MPYESYTDRLRREQLEEARLRLGDKLNVDYNRAQEVLRLRAATGLPEQLIDSDFDNISEMVRQREFDPNTYKDSAPAWRQFASENPMNLAVLKHDEEWLTQYERAYREMDSTTGMERFFSHTRDIVRETQPIRNAWQSSWAQNEMMMIGARQQRGDIRPGDEEKLAELRKYQVSHDFGADWSKPIVWLTKQSANMIVSGQRRLERGLQGGLTGAAIGGAYGAAGGTFILPGGGTAVGGAGGAVGGFGIGFTGGAFYGGYEIGAELGRGEAFLEYRDMGFSIEDAAWAAEISGNVSGTIEATLGQVFFSKLPGVRNLTRNGGQEVVKQLMGRETFRQVAGRAAFDYGAGVTSEIVTEVLQEASLITMGEILKGRHPGVAEELTGEEIASRIADVALETLKSTFLIAGAGPGQRLIMDGRRARDAQNFATVVREMAEGVQNADMPKNLPKHWKAFLERVHEGGNVESIGMPVQAFDEYWQAQGVDPEVAAQELGINNLDEARTLGLDVQIPMRNFHKIAQNTETFNQMLPNLRPHDDTFTLREAEQYLQEREQVMELLEEASAKVRETEQDADIEAIVQDVQNQLVAADYDQGSAAQLAQIMRGIGIMAKRNDMDPMPLYEQIFGGVQRTTEGAETARQDVDAFIDPLLNRLRNKNFPTQREMFGPSLMDFIASSGGVDIGDPELVAMDFELGANELGVSKAKLKQWKKEGRDVSALAEIAAEAGYIPANEENLLLDGIREELAGKYVYGSVEGGTKGMRDLAKTLDDLAVVLDEAGIDLDEMTNAEVRQALNERTTLAQIDTKELQNLTKLVMHQIVTAEEAAQTDLQGIGGDEMQVDTMLARAAAMLPIVDETQDFGDLTISDRVRIEETGRKGTREVRARDKFRQAVKRKNIVQKLLDCVSG